MRRALIVGIDAYAVQPLNGCVNDARRMCEMLERHGDGAPNFGCRLLTAPSRDIERRQLLENIQELFGHEAEVALLHFSGHGTINNLDGYLVTQNASCYDEGVGMSEVIRLANASRASEVVVLLDCCHSGALGNLPAVDNTVQLREGVSVLTASRGTQVSVEGEQGGLFTSFMYEALRGGAADVAGNVTLAGIYAYADGLLDAWSQRPLYKSHVSKMLALRRCKPRIEPELLRKLPQYFEEAGCEYPVDSTYDAELPPAHPEHEAIFADFREYLKNGLLEPVGEHFLYHAAKNNKSCRLTPLGEFYRQLAAAGRI